MVEDTLRYDALVEDALRGVVRGVLAKAAEEGLPGEHHFYITFRTDHPEVEIGASLKERYPTDMTIVIQHQYWDLKVEDDFFEVTLSFSNVPQTMHIPFEAVTTFADPSVRFGLQFDGAGLTAEQETAEQEIAEEETAEDGESEEGEAADDAEAVDGAKSEEQDKPAAGDGNVVTLDSFRKK